MAQILVPSQQPTIQSAVNIAQLYDEILVADGIYNENVTVNKNDIKIIADGNNVILQGSGSGIGFNVSNANNVEIRGFNVERYKYGIYLNSSSNNTITENTCSENSTGGSGSSEGVGIYINNSSNNTITENTCSENTGGGGGFCKGVGIYINNSSNNTITENTCSENTGGGGGFCKGVGIYINNSSNNKITKNTCSENTAGGGGFCKGVGIYINNSSNNKITKNTCSENTRGGSGSNEGVGICFYIYSDNNTVICNTFSNNDNYGMYMDNSNSNKIYNNNFITNTIQAKVVDSTNNIFYLNPPIGGNFWSDHTTPDNNNDGFVDTPYVFEGGQDNYPLTSPNGLLCRPPIKRPGRGIPLSQTGITSIF